MTLTQKIDELLKWRLTVYHTTSWQIHEYRSRKLYPSSSPILSIVVERLVDITPDELSLFKLTQLAQDATNSINSEEGAIPHGVIEQAASEHLGNE